ncbi:hypothetical protein, partial [Parvularcula marina]|uniref:hypothetical protein n=1 Tax=Parvularcula marina TaxID=2292771 RepID=UPI0035154928
VLFEAGMGAVVAVKASLAALGRLTAALTTDRPHAEGSASPCRDILPAGAGGASRAPRRSGG